MTRRSLLTAGLLLLAAGDPVVGQEPTNQLLRTAPQHERILGPVLEVRQLSGEFEQWGREVTVTAPSAEVFRWSTPASGIASAMWSVMEGPPGSDASVVGSGSAGTAPRTGSVTVFRIDFRKFMPSGPPAGGKTYWVVLEPVDAVGQARPTSLPVQVTYANQAGQANIAAFAGREADMAAPTQMALSKTSKLAFLQELVAKSVELLGEDSDVAVAATDDIPDAQVRLTPMEPISFAVSPDAINPSSSPHKINIEDADWVMFWSWDYPEGTATFSIGGAVEISIHLEAGETYLLDVEVFTNRDVTLYLKPTDFMYCLVDYQSEQKDFSLGPGAHHLLATVMRPPSLSSNVGCRFFLKRGAAPGYNPSTHPTLWSFRSIELTRLAKM